jgi:hypothetical protein
MKLFLLLILILSVIGQLFESESEDINKSVRMVPDADEDGYGRNKKRIVNFASESAGAVVLESSVKFKGIQNLLNDHKDKYGMIECSEEKKWVVIVISEDVI